PWRAAGRAGRSSGACAAGRGPAARTGGPGGGPVGSSSTAKAHDSTGRRAAPPAETSASSRTRRVRAVTGAAAPRRSPPTHTISPAASIIGTRPRSQRGTLASIRKVFSLLGAAEGGEAVALPPRTH